MFTAMTAACSHGRTHRDGVEALARRVLLPRFGVRAIAAPERHAVTP